MFNQIPIWLINFAAILIIRIEAIPDCNFANKYSSDELIKDSGKRNEFLMAAAYWEGRFATHGNGLNVNAAVTYDGTQIDEDTGLQHAPLHDFSAASKESIHLGLLALALDGNLLKSLFRVIYYRFLRSNLTWPKFSNALFSSKTAPFRNFGQNRLKIFLNCFCKESLVDRRNNA